MPNRVIKDSIKRSPQIDSLTWFEEVVFIHMIITADDYGCLDGRMVVLRNDLFPTKENVTKKAIEDAVSKLVSVGLLRQYEVNGMPYLFFPTWEKHQRIRNKFRKYPVPAFDSNLPSNVSQSSAVCSYELQSESESNPNPNTNSAPDGGEHKKSIRFTPPSPDEVNAYCRENGYTVDGQAFCDFYASKGWKVGNTPMKDWQAAVRTWARHDYKQTSQRPAKTVTAQQYGQRDYTENELMAVSGDLIAEALAKYESGVTA